jgi:hypothetical protein
VDRELRRVGCRAIVQGSRERLFDPRRLPAAGLLFGPNVRGWTVGSSMQY